MRRQEGSLVSDLVLRIEDVSKTYPGVRALDRFSIDCRAGEVHAVLGENGSGKTTLMKIASGTIVPDGGLVEINGERLTSADPRLAHRLGLATVYQDDLLIRELSVAQNLFLAAPPRLRPVWPHDPVGAGTAETDSTFTRIRERRSDRCRQRNVSSLKSSRRCSRTPKSCCSTSPPPPSTSMVCASSLS